jgi:outer membrane protein assembly factor BamB
MNDFSRILGARCGLLLMFALAAVLAEVPRADAQRNLRDNGDEPQPLGELVYARNSALYRNFSYALSRGDHVQTLKIVQAILDLPDDSFVVGEAGAVRSLKQSAFDYLESLTPPQLRGYQREHDIDAELLLSEARKSGRARDYLDVIERFYFTDSGFHATDWLATRELDVGRFLSAARMWNELIDSRVHGPKATPALLFKAAIANRLCGEGERAAELMQRVHATVEGRKLSGRLETYLESVARRAETPPRAARSLPEEWSLSLVDSLETEEQKFLDEWRHEHWSGGGYPLFVNRSAVALDGLLCVRDYNGLLFADLETGQSLGRYPMSPPLREIADNHLGMDSWYQQGLRRFSTGPDFREYFAWNTLHGQLSHDESRVYLIEGDDSWARGRTNRPGERIRARVGGPGEPDVRADPVPVNSLVAFSMAEPAALEGEPAPIWRIDDQSVELGNAYFLAPPLNLDGILYTLAEVEKSIRLIGLDPKTGKLLWSQGIAIPPNPLYEDQDRRLRGCAIVEAGGLLVVTTQIGIISAIDPLRRRLQWAYYVGENDPRRFGGPFGNDLVSYGYLGFPDRPLIDGDRVLLLPRQSRNLHCLELKSGKLLWKAERDRHGASSEPSLGDEFLGGTAGGTLLVVGTTRSRGLSVADGREQWNVEHPRVAGRGVLHDGEYLLPLENSRLLRLIIETGQSRQLLLDATSRTPTPHQGVPDDQSLRALNAPNPEFGHLMRVGDRLLSLGLERVRSMAVPEAKLEHLRLAGESSRLSRRQRWELALYAPPGELDLRESLLAELAAQSAPDDSLREQARDEYRELLFERLQSDAPRDSREKLAGELSPLLETDEHHIRFLMLQSRLQMQSGDGDGVLESLRHLTQLESAALFPDPDEPHLLLSLGAWNRKLWDWANLGLRGAERNRFELFLQSRIQQALAADDPEPSHRLLEQFPGLRQLDPVRLRLARMSVEQRQFHAAEMLLLTVLERTPAGELQAAARLDLARLWARFGETPRAAALLVADRDSPQAPHSDQRQRAIAELRSDPRFELAWNNLHPPRESPRQVQVASHPPSERQSMIRREYEYFRIFPTPHDCPFDLLADRTSPYADSRFARGRLLDDASDKHVLKIISRSRGTIDAEIEIPTRASTTTSEEAVVGHFFPLGSPGQVRGLSLLDVADGAPIWTRSFLEPEMTDILFVGPCNSEFVTFRNRDTLLALDSRTGRVLWRRNALAPRDGFNSGRMPKLFGDDQVVVRLGDDDLPPNVFRSFTGESVTLRRQVSPIGMLGAVGRFAIQIRYGQANSTSEGRGQNASVVLIDMSSGEEVWQAPYWNSACFKLIRDRMVLITPERELKVINPLTLDEELSVPLSNEECTGVTNLEFFSDARNHYVNIGRIDDQNAGLRASRYSQPVSNPFLPSIRIEGVLLAIDRETGARRWSRMMPACAILESPHERLPFLVSLSKLTRQRIPNIQRLQVEVLSLEDGSSLAVTDDFIPHDQHTALFHTVYDAAQGTFDLHGPMYHARIRFPAAWDRLIEEWEPF